MRTQLFFLLSFFLSAALPAQPMFSNQGVLLSSNNIHSGVAMAVVDVNKDGLDDIIRLDKGTNVRIEFQDVGGGFSAYIFPTALSTRTWGITVADVDGNGTRDFAVGGTGASTEVWFADPPLVRWATAALLFPKLVFFRGPTSLT